MPIRPTALLAVALTCAAVAVTTTVTAPAGASPGPTGRLAALQRDLGLSPAQARTRLSHDGSASEVARTMKADLGSHFGGAYLSGGRLVVNVTDRASAGLVRAAGATPRLVRASEAALVAGVHRLDAAAPPAGVRGWHVDLPGDRVVVETTSRSTAAARRFAARAGAVPTRVVRTAAPRPLRGVRAGDAWYGRDFRCSIGFAARGAGGVKAFVTAGHCTTGHGRAYGYDHSALGRLTASTFGPTGDFGEVTVTGASWSLVGTVNHYGGASVKLKGSTPAVVGAAVCRTGSTTGWHCGTITATDQTVVYSDARVTGLTRTDVCAEPGDSGGAFVSGTQAQGVTSGGSGDCTTGGTTYFQPVTEALTAYHLSLVTS